MIHDAYEADVIHSFKVVIHNRSIIDRVLQNHDDQGVPQPLKRGGTMGGTGWQDMFYQFDNEDDLIRWLADCIGQRGYTLSRMDGYADLNDDDITVEQVD